jgi:hypothetical protein
MRELKRKEAQLAVPSSSAPAVLGSHQPPPRKKRARHAAFPTVPEWMEDSETQDMDAWELQCIWDRERLEDQGVLLDSSSEEEPEEHGPGDADSLDLCEINTQERVLMADYNARRPQWGEEMPGDTQETAIEIE